MDLKSYTAAITSAPHAWGYMFCTLTFKTTTGGEETPPAAMTYSASHSRIIRSSVGRLMPSSCARADLETSRARYRR